MNIQLTTRYLQKSCRLCLNKGDFDLWEHQVTLPNLDGEHIQASEECEVSENGNLQCTAYNLFKIYGNYQDAFFGLNEDLKLLCFACLDQLTNCYIFCKKAINSNKEIQRLYKEALKLETEQQHLDDVIVEDYETESAEASQSENDLLNAEETEELDSLIEQTSLIEESEPEEDLANITNILENEDLLTKSLSTENLIESLEDKTTSEITSDDNENPKFIEEENITKSPETKRQRCKPPRDKGPPLPPPEDSSLIVTQFLPATAHIVLENVTSPENLTGEEGDGEILTITHTHDLNTVDFAAVEIKSSNFHQIIEEELQIQSNVKPKNINETVLESYGTEQQREEDSESLFVCKYCPQAFSASHYLIAHVRKSHVCKYCTQAFVKSMDLFVHIRQAHHQHKCAICNKELSSHSNLRGHIKRVHGIRLPAQVALLDYRPPNSSTVDEKQSNNAQVDTPLDDMDMYF